MSTISASTTLTTALQYTADTTGTLVFKTGATPTTALTLNSDQSATFAGTVNFATAAFTNLSYTGTLTGGTGVLDIGSGQFYKNADGNVGVGTSSLINYGANYRTFTINCGVGGGSFIDMTVNGVRTGTFYAGAFEVGYGATQAIPVTFRTNDNERMRIDSTGKVGIGTSTNLTALLNFPTADSGEVINIFASATEATRSGIGKYSGETRYYVATNDFFAWRTGGPSGTERMRIDGSGNVGIGTISPVSVGGYGALTLNGTTGSLVYLQTNASSAMQISTNASGAAITAIGASLPLYFSTNSAERMRIDSSGNVLIGTSTATAPLTVQGTTSGGTAWFKHNGANSFGTVVTIETTAGTDDPTLSFKNYNGGSPVYYGIAGTDDGSLAFKSGAYNGGFGTERMRITSDGNLLVGTTTPASNSSNTIVGTSTGATLALAVVHNATNEFVRGVLSVCPSYSGNDGYLYIGSAGGSDKFYVRTSGNVQNSNNSYGAISDVKLKENIVDATPKLDKLMQVKVRSYNLKADPTHKQIGVVAQELEEVFPNLIEESTLPDGSDTIKTVKYSVFVPMLIKAIQELKAEFDEYKATHP
jgi:hypothetical protein